MVVMAVSNKMMTKLISYKYVDVANDNDHHHDVGGDEDGLRRPIENHCLRDQQLSKQRKGELAVTVILGLSRSPVN